jgi:hypothetical protein
MLLGWHLVVASLYLSFRASGAHRRGELAASMGRMVSANNWGGALAVLAIALPGLGGVTQFAGVSRDRRA